MATLVINCDGSSNSFQNNGNIRISYTSGSGKVLVSKIEGMRTDGYSSYQDTSPQYFDMTIGGITKRIRCNRLRFSANSSYADWGMDETEWTGLNGSVGVVVGNFSSTSGLAYHGCTFSSSSTAIIAGVASYTISYHANGGTGAPDSQVKTKGTNLTLSSTKPTRTGYTFDGWSMSNEGLGTTYSSGGSFSQDADVILFAVWTPIPQIKVKSNSSWITGDLMYKSNNAYSPASIIKLKTKGDF